MADDIFLTPEEQDERARQWLKDNGPALAIGIALGLAAIFGWNYYKDSQLEKAQAASALFASTMEQVEASDLAGIDSQLAEFKSKYPKTPYASKIALIKAKQLSLSDKAAAYDELQWVVDNAPEFGLQHTARIRQAKLKFAMGDLEAAKALASFQPTQGFTSHYSEILGDIAVAQKDPVSARAYYQAAIDGLTPGQAAYAQLITIKMDRLPSQKDTSEAADTSSAETADDSTTDESE